MAKKGKDSGKQKGRQRDKKDKGKRHQELPRDLPTIVEEDVSNLDDQILGYLHELKQEISRRHDTIMTTLSVNASQIQTLAALLGQQGKAIEVLTKTVSELEAARNAVQNTDNVTFR
ncbi:hypothetical protein PIB30_038176 [Stylosanthes scabra]|uniref:Uncharacterized protein n=1 Tax=Stylosanthes scabra TaxID=79078 RepID=A0ABU6YEC0_9FABA|nr:hypothetical protein [Stylosanthes scabra]